MKEGGLQRSLLWGGHGCVVLYSLLQALPLSPYDDAYFFKRFAVNQWRYGSFAWNLTDGPVYGATSQLLQWLAVPLVIAAPDHYVLAVRMLLAGCLIAASFLLVRALEPTTGSRGGAGSLVLLALSAPTVLVTIVSGMETALCLLLLAGALVGLQRGHSPFPMALWTWVIYLCRPDAALIPALAFMLHRRTGSQTRRYALWLIALMIPWLLAAWSYYGMALPLPFHMKTLGLSPYGSDVLRASLVAKLRYGALFAGFSLPLLWVIACGGAARCVYLWLPALVFCLYHLLLNNEIMGYHARFYVPAVIPLLLAAAVSWERYTQGASLRRTGTLLLLWGITLVTGAALAGGAGAGLAVGPVSASVCLVYWALAAWTSLARACVAPLQGSVAVALALLSAIAGRPPTRLAVPSDRQLIVQQAREVTTLRGLFAVERCLGPSPTVFHSELGATGVLLLDATVVDLAGILSVDAVGPGAFERLCRRHRPQAIFLPHKGYAGLNAEAQRSPCFEGYVRVVERSSSPLHVRRDLAPGFLRCADQMRRAGEGP